MVAYKYWSDLQERIRSEVPASRYRLGLIEQLGPRKPLRHEKEMAEYWTIPPAPQVEQPICRSCCARFAR